MTALVFRTPRQRRARAYVRYFDQVVAYDHRHGQVVYPIAPDSADQYRIERSAEETPQ